MSTRRPRNLQLPLRPRTLLITDVTRLQPFTAGGDNFCENIETLVSYNVRTDGLQQDCLYIEQGHLMTPTTFMTYSMAIDLRKSIVVTWTPIRMYSMPQQGSKPSSLPGSPLYTSSQRPVIPSFMPYPTKPKGGWQRPHQVVVNKSTTQIREKKAALKFMNKYQEIIQNSMAQGPNNPEGPFLYQEDGKTYASLPTGMLKNIQKSPLFDKMQKDCKVEGIEIPKTIMAKDPVAHMLTPQEYLQKVAAGLMPQMDNHQMMKELAEKNDQMKILMMEFRDIEHPLLPTTPQAPKHKSVT